MGFWLPFCVTYIHVVLCFADSVCIITAPLLNLISLLIQPVTCFDICLGPLDLLETRLFHWENSISRCDTRVFLFCFVLFFIFMWHSYGKMRDFSGTVTLSYKLTNDSDLTSGLFSFVSPNLLEFVENSYWDVIYGFECVLKSCLCPWKHKFHKNLMLFLLAEISTEW